MSFDSTEWSREVGAALQVKGLTNHAVSQRLRISHATFSSWMSGRTRPSVEMLPEISNITDIPIWRLHYLAGLLPAEYSPAVMFDQAWERQVSLYKGIRMWAGQMTDALSVRPAGMVVGIATEEDQSWQVTVRPNQKGIRYRIAPNTAILLEGESGASVNDLRHEVTTKMGAKLARAGAIWRRQKIRFWDVKRQLVLEVPEYERTREAQELERRTDFSRNIVCMGLPYAHSELLGALVAEALGYGFENPTTTALQSVDNMSKLTVEQIGRSSMARVENLLGSTDKRAYHRIFTIAYPCAQKILLTEARAIIADVEFIYVRTSEAHLVHAAEFWGMDIDKLRDFQSWLEESAITLGTRCDIIDIGDDGFGEPELERGSAVSSADDEFVDRVIDAALDYVQRRTSEFDLRPGFLADARRQAEWPEGS